MELGNKYICPYCGQEIDNGLMNHIRHIDVCTNDAPNESIEFHFHEKEINEKQKKFEKDLNTIYSVANVVEKEKIFQFYCIGIPENGIRLYGMDLFLEFSNYIEELKTKYKIE